MLRSVVEQMGATGFAQVALILFFSVFMSVLLREALRSKREVKHAENLPLADDDVMTMNKTSKAGEPQ